MANWCSNTVEFRGDADRLQQLKDLLRTIQEKGKREDKGQLSDFVIAEDGYLFDLELGLFPTVLYETRWVGNTEVIRQIAEHFGVGFVYQYCEPMNGVSGEAHYFGGI